MNPDFNKCEKVANELLFTTDISSFPIDVTKLKYKQAIYFDSMQTYCEYTNITLTQLIGKDHYQDGFNIISKDYSLILYNENIIVDERISWTLAHEVGHVLLKHRTDDEDEEVEAHHFASHLFMPNPIIYELIKRRVPINAEFLIKVFGVSPEAATKKLTNIRKFHNKMNDTYNTEYNDIILHKFNGFIDKIAPRFEEMPEENNLYDRWDDKKTSNPFMSRFRNN